MLRAVEGEDGSSLFGDTCVVVCEVDCQLCSVNECPLLVVDEVTSSAPSLRTNVNSLRPQLKLPFSLATYYNYMR